MSLKDALKGRDPGWYIVNETSSATVVMRGPYIHQETAQEVRREIENKATQRQMELWNLLILVVYPKKEEHEKETGTQRSE